MNRFRTLALVVLVSVTGPACTRYIPNTTVRDTDENRVILDFMEDYRHAVENRDVAALLAMADPTYLDDVGTPTSDDDLDHDNLSDRLRAWQTRVREIRFEIRYHRVATEGERIHVEYRYTASFKMPNAGGEDRWARRVADARAILVRNDEGELRFLSGL